MSIEGKLIPVKSFTGDPSQPGLDPEYHRGWFVRQAVFGKLTFYRASEAELEHILNQLLDYFYLTAENNEQFLREKNQILDVVWPWLKPRLERNKGLVKFMEQYGVYSRYFVSLLMRVPGALALCPAHGECLDIFDKPQKVPKWDKLYQFIWWDEMYAFARLRAEDAKIALEDESSRSLILGAGTLQEVRKLKRFGVERLKTHDKPWLVAYDSDVTLERYFALVLEDSLDAYGIKMYYKDFVKHAFLNPDYCEEFDFIGAWGVASYYNDRLEWFLTNVRDMLKLGGVVKFDVQVLDGGSKLRKRFWQHTLVFDKVIMLWETNMDPFPSVHDAVQRVESICSEIGLRIDYCKYDPRNQIGVIFQCSKI